MRHRILQYPLNVFLYAIYNCKYTKQRKKMNKNTFLNKIMSINVHYETYNK